MSETVEKKKKGSKQTEQVIGSAAYALSASVRAYEKAKEAVDKFPELIESYTLQVTNLEDKIDTLRTKYAEEKRQFEVQLELDKKVALENVSNAFLSEQGKVAIKSSDWNTMQTDLNKYRTETQSLINADVARATNAMKSNHENEMKLKDLMHEKSQSDNIAKISSLTQQLEAAIKDARNWQEQLAAERAAGIARAQASSVGTINVSTPK